MTAPQITAGRATANCDPPAVGDAAPPHTAKSVRALSRIEGPRLLRHPAFVAGAALSVLFSDHDGARQRRRCLSAADGRGPRLAGGGNAAGRQPRGAAHAAQRHHKATRAASARPLATTLAHLLSIAWAVAAAVVFVVAAFLLTGAAGGLEIDAARRTAIPSGFELAQGPAAVAVSGGAGIALARAAASLAASGLLVVVLLAGDMMLPSQNGETGLAWFAPVVNTAVASSATEWPWNRPVDASCEVVGF